MMRPAPSSPANAEAGFSLLEALIALSILAIAAAGLIGAAEAHIDRISGLEARAVASWVAENELTALRLSAAPPTSASGIREMAGETWRVDVATAATDDPDLVRVDITVSNSDQRQAGARLSGFVDSGVAR